MITKAKLPSPASVMQARESGRVLDDIGVFEVDLIENRITWANDYGMEKSGYTLDQMKHMTLFEVVPQAFHGDVQEAIADATASDRPSVEKRFTSIWPMQTSSGKIVWWAVTKTITDFPLTWVYADHVQTTSHSGMSYVFMRAFMRAANKQSGLYNQISELKAWTAAQIERLDEEDKRLRIELSALEKKLEEALAASKESAEASKATAKMMEGIRKTFEELEAKYGAEILKLIGTDVVHDKRIEAFEKHMKMTTDLAIKSIEIQAKNSSGVLAKQAEETSRGLSKKVVIPVSVIAGIVTIIQILVEHYVK